MRVSIGCFLVFFASVQLNAQVRSVFKGVPPAVVMTDSLSWKKMTFGLTERQMASISALTEGRIQMGNVHFLDHSVEREFSSMPGFSGVILPNVPPPVGEGQQQEFPSRRGDPELRNQWWIEKLGVQEAWLQATGQGVTIADCDAGFYHDEPDLRGNMILEYKADLSDKDEPHVVDDGPFATHGTSVTAIIAGVFNGIGTNGIAYNSKIIPLQNFNYDQSDDLDKEEATAKCILKAISLPAVRIIVLENQTANGSSETFVGTRDAVRLALQSGLIIVSAAGNYGVELSEEKRDDTGSIIVGALLQDDTVPHWSNFGERVAVSAYGEKLHTLSGPNGAFTQFGGTSGATPQVAATVALMLETHPLLTPEQARQALLDSRRVTPVTEKVGGILNVPGALMAARNARTDFQAWSQQSLFREQLRSILLHP